MAKPLGAPESLPPLHSLRFLANLLGFPSVADLESAAEAAEGMYRPFEQLKSSGKVRVIDNPSNRLKRVQTRIKTHILDRAVLPPFVCGGVKKRSTLTNAVFHLRRPEVVKLDLRSFFPNVGTERVHKMWKRVFQASERSARLLTKFTTCAGHLPQGSPASSAIANIVALPLSVELHDLCVRNQLAFSIYVDDIILSGDCPRLFLPEVMGMVRAHGFHVKSQKVEVMTGSVSQEVTGVVVNRTASTPRSRRSKVAGELLRALETPPSDVELRRLRGSVQHIHMINPRQGQRPKRLLKAVEAETRPPDSGA